MCINRKSDKHAESQIVPTKRKDRRRGIQILRKMFWRLHRIKLYLNLGTTKVQFNAILFLLAEPFVRVAGTKCALEY